MRTLALATLFVLVAVLFLTGCASEQIADVQRMVNGKSELDDYSKRTCPTCKYPIGTAERTKEVSEYWDKVGREAIEKDRKALARKQAEAAPFCALSPTQRDAKVAADWQTEKDRPGSSYTSYSHMRAVMHHRTGC